LFKHFQNKNTWDDRLDGGGSVGMKSLEKFQVFDLMREGNVQPSKILVGQETKPPEGTLY